VQIESLFVYSGMSNCTEMGYTWAQPGCHSPDLERVRACRVDWNFVRAIGGLVTGDVGVLGGTFRDRLIGVTVSMVRFL